MFEEKQVRRPSLITYLPPDRDTTSLDFLKARLTTLEAGYIQNLLYEGLNYYPYSTRITSTTGRHIPRIINFVANLFSDLQKSEHERQSYYPYWFLPNRLIILPKLSADLPVLIPEREEYFLPTNHNSSASHHLARLIGIKLASLRVSQIAENFLESTLNQPQLYVLSSLINNFSEPVIFNNGTPERVIRILKKIIVDSGHSTQIESLKDGSFKLNALY